MNRFIQLLLTLINLTGFRMVAAKGENYPINWTEAIPVGMGFESHYQDPAVTPLAPCPCDLTLNRCNLHCCCDPDCKQYEKASFECIEGLEGGQETPQDLDYNCNYVGPFSPEWHGFLCYIKNNNPYLGLFFKNEKVIQEYQKYLTKVRKPKYSYESSVLDTDEDMSFHFQYKVNRPVEMLIQYGEELGRSPLVVPQGVLHGICIPSIPVLFLKDSRHQCSVSLSQEVCENEALLSYDSYLQDNEEINSEFLSTVISNLASLETVNASVNYLCLKNPLKFLKVNGLSKTALEFMKVRWDTMVEYFEECNVKNKPFYNNTSKMCENVVLSVDYRLGWKGPNITEVNVEMILGNVPVNIGGVYQNYFTELDEGVVIDKHVLEDAKISHKQQHVGLLQNFEVQWYYNELSPISNYTNNMTVDAGNDTFTDEELENLEFDLVMLSQRSGNPGYDVGKPVLAGYVINNTTDFENETYKVFSHVDINDGTGLYIWLPDATSKCENVATDLVNFGIDAYSSCIYSYPSNYSCKEIREEILSMMSQLVLSDVVSKMGSPNLTEENNFLTVMTNFENETEVNTTRCFVPTALQHEIIYRDIASNEDVNSLSIYQIIGIFIRYEYTEVFLNGRRNGTELTLSSSVVHFNSPRPSGISRFWELMEDRWCEGGTCWKELLYPWTHGTSAKHEVYNEHTINLMRNSALILLLSFPIVYFLLKKNLEMRLEL